MCDGVRYVRVCLCLDPLPGFFTSAESKLQKAFKATADSLRESFRFAHSDKPEVLAAYGITEE